MAKIIIKLENGAYNYYENDILTKSKLPVRTVKKDESGNMTVGDIVLPENPIGKKTISTTRFKDGITEYDLANATVRNSTASTTKSTKSTKINYDEHYTEDEAAKVKKHYDAIEKINAEVRARVEKEIAVKALEESAAQLTVEQLQAILAKKMEVKA